MYPGSLPTFSILDFQEHVLVPQHTLSGADGTGARKVHFPDFSKDMFLRSQMKNVVKYCVCCDVLLMVSIYVTKYLVVSRKTQKWTCPSSVIRARACMRCGEIAALLSAMRHLFLRWPTSHGEAATASRSPL